MMLKVTMKVVKVDVVDIKNFQYVPIELIPLIPYIIAIWLVKLNWRNIN